MIASFNLLSIQDSKTIYGCIRCIQSPIWECGKLHVCHDINCDVLIEDRQSGRHRRVYQKSETAGRTSSTPSLIVRAFPSFCIASGWPVANALWAQTHIKQLRTYLHECGDRHILSRSTALMHIVLRTVWTVWSCRAFKPLFFPAKLGLIGTKIIHVRTYICMRSAKHRYYVCWNRALGICTFHRVPTARHANAQSCRYLLSGGVVDLY
jgi:hypothetical protein